MAGLVAVTSKIHSSSGGAGDLAKAMGERLRHRGAVSSIINVGGGAVASIGDATTAKIGNVAVCLHGTIGVSEHTLSILRPRLSSNGAPWGSAEIAAALIERWGAKGIDRMSGDFAVVALSVVGELIAASRDRSGLKPLLWREHDGRAAFASEAAALVDVRGLPRPSVNEAMVAEYLCGAPQHRAESVWAGVDRVEPRSMIVRSGNRNIVERTPFAFDSRGTTSVRDWNDELHDTFVGAVEQRLDNRVTAIELSGGFDSTTVLGVAASLKTPQELLAAVRDYTGTPTEETVYWRAALDEYNVDALITPWDVELDPWMLDDAQATADRPCLPHLGPWRRELATLSSRGIRTSLTGQGGDERLGHSYQLPWQLLGSGRVVAATRAAQHHLGVDRKTALQLLVQRGPRRVARWHVPAVKPSDRHLRTRVWLREDLIGRVDLARRTRAPRYTSHSMTADELAGWAFGEIPNQYLEAAERCSARQGIDLRHPFVDPDLVELCLRMPESIRTSPTDPRAAHRRVFGNYLPDAVLNRQDKADFTSQYVDRMSSEGIFVDADTAAVVEAGWIERDWLADALDRLASGSNGAAALVSILATVEAWAQRWV